MIKEIIKYSLLIVVLLACLSCKGNSYVVVNTQKQVVEYDEKFRVKGYSRLDTLVVTDFGVPVQMIKRNKTHSK